MTTFVTTFVAITNPRFVSLQHGAGKKREVLSLTWCEYIGTTEVRGASIADH